MSIPVTKQIHIPSPIQTAYIKAVQKAQAESDTVPRLNAVQLQLIQLLQQDPDLSVNEMAEAVHKDRSVVLAALRRLVYLNYAVKINGVTHITRDWRDANEHK